MKRLLYILIGILFLQQASSAQPLIGMKKADILVYMKQNEPDFALDNAVINKKYNYLKYYDRVNEETILCFLTDIDVCHLVRRMSDYSNLDLTLKKLDKQYKKVEKDKWVYTVSNDDFIVEMKREKWYFTLETRRKK